MSGIALGGRASHREAGSLTKRPGHSKRGRASQSEARPLAKRQGRASLKLRLSQYCPEGHFKEQKIHSKGTSLSNTKKSLPNME